MAKPFKPGFFSNLNGIKDNNDRPPLAGGAGVSNTFTNLGTGARVFSALVGADVRFRTITVGPNLAVAETADNVNITFTGTLGEVNTGTNLGTTGARVFSAKSGVSLTFRRLAAVAGSGITVTENTSDITIGTVPATLATLIAPLLALGETNTASNRGSGEGVFAAKVGVDLQFKSLVAGPNVTIESDTNTITIGSTGGGGGGGPGGTPAAIRNQVSADQEIPINTPTVVLFPTNNHDTTADLSYSAGVISTVTGGVHHITTMVRVETPPVGVVSNVRLTIEVSNAAQTVWTVIAEDLQVGALSTNASATFQCSTDWNLVAGAGVRTRLSYQSTLAGVLRVVFPVGSEPIGHLGVHRVAVADQLVYSGQNLGTGQGEVFKQLTGSNTFQYRTLRAGNGVSVTQDADEVTIATSTPPLMIGTLEAATTSTTAFATKGSFVILSAPLTVKGIWFWVDPAATTETYVCNISRTSGTIVGSTVTSIIATGGLTQATGTIGEVLFSLFPSPVTLTAGTYLFSVTQTNGATTAALRLGSPSGTTGYVTLGTPVLKYSVGSNTVQIASNNLTVGNAVGAIGTSQGYGVFPII